MSGLTFRSFAQVLCRCFVFLILSCVSFLCIFEINPLSVVSFAIIFSHSESYLFTLLIVSFAVQKLISLTRSHFFIFVFIFFVLFQEVGHKEPCYNLYHTVFCLYFPLRVF